MAAGFDFDVIDAHYFYPDGVAAAALAERFGKPFVVTARGSDINLLARLPGPGRRILDVAGRASAIIAVSAALRRAMAGVGIPAERVTVLRQRRRSRPLSARCRAKKRAARSGCADRSWRRSATWSRRRASRSASYARSRSAPTRRGVVVGVGPERRSLERRRIEPGAGEPRPTFSTKCRSARLRDVYCGRRRPRPRVEPRRLAERSARGAGVRDARGRLRRRRRAGDRGRRRRRPLVPADDDGALAAAIDTLLRRSVGPHRRSRLRGGRSRGTP